MSFGFANAALLGLLALGVVPLLIHLFARQRPPVAEFPSLLFLEKALKQAVRFKKPQSWLLLILRTLAVLALAAVFARPLFYGAGKTADAGTARHAVVIVDASASMAAVESGRSRFDSACDEAVSILRGLAPGDSADVVWMGPKAEAVFPEMGRNIGFLETALATAVPTRGRANVPAALDLATALLEDVDGVREIYVVSDFQATGWEGISLSGPPNVKLHAVRAGGGEPVRNMAVTSVVTDPASPLAGEAVRVSAKVENFSYEPMGTAVFFEAGAVRQSQEVLVPAGGSGDVVFSATFDGDAAQAVAVSITEDSFGADDTRHAVVRPGGRLRVAIVPGAAPETAAVWERAVRAFAWAEVVALGEGDVDVAFLAGWNGGDGAVLGEMVAGGGTLVCLPGDGFLVGDLEKFVGETSGGAFRTERNGDGFRVRVDSPGSDVLEIFRDGGYGEPVGGSFSARVTGGSFGESLLAFDDGSPALARASGSGQVYLWTLPLGGEDTAWPSTAGFLTFMGELLFQARDFAARSDADVVLAPGDALLWRSPKNLVAGEAALIGPDSPDPLSVDTVLSPDGGTDLAAGEAAVPGIYTWSIAGEADRLQVVGFPVDESDLSVLEAPPVVEEGVVGEATGFTSSAELQLRREGRPLWPLLVGIVAVLVSLESVVLLINSRRAV